MQRTFTCVTLYTLTCLLCTPLIAQPVTTASAIRYGEVISIYNFELDDTMTWKLGPSMSFDFTEFGDKEINYYDEDWPVSGPAKDLDPSLLESYTFFKADQTFRDAFDGALPENVIRLSYKDPSDERFVEENLALVAKPLGLYQLGYQEIELEDGKPVSEIELFDEEELVIPFGLKYGEKVDSISSEVEPSVDYPGVLDSFIYRTTYEYLGIGTFKTWTGPEVSVGVILINKEYHAFRGNESGNYGEEFTDIYLSNVYLMGVNSALPLAFMDGDYDSKKGTIGIDYLALTIQTSDAPSAVTTAGIPGAAIEVFPNPTHGAFRVDLTLDRATTLDLELYSAAGQRLSRRGGLAVVPGINRLPVSERELAAGLYLVKLTLADGSSETRRVVVN